MYLSEGLSSKRQQINVGEDVEKGTVVHCWWEYKVDANTVENSMEILQKIKNRTTIDLAILLLDILLKKTKMLIEKIHALICLLQDDL